MEKIELIPGLNDKDIKFRFEKNLFKCLNVKGCVAFWTVKVNYFQATALKEAIKRKNSFYCVDIQQPTNIDSLAEYVNQGAAEIYLHKYRLDPNSTQYHSNTNLLHSKVIMFEFPNDEIEIWIGSHNLTHFALSGLNLEASTVINCNKSDKIYSEMLSYLEYVKNAYCDKFDPKKVEFYKRLQSKEAKRNVIIDGGIRDVEDVVTLVGVNMENLEKEEVILLLSLNGGDFAKFKKAANVFLHTFDIKSQKENLYGCRISQLGENGSKNSKLNIDFTQPRRFAYIGTGQLSYLKDSMKVDEKILQLSKSFVSLTIQRRVESFQVFQKPTLEENSLWKSVDKTPYNRMGYRYKIEVATYEDINEPIPLKIGDHWRNLSQKREEFYKKLDAEIEKEHELTKASKSEEMDKWFNNFLKDYYHSLPQLPQYAKSKVERIIYERNK